MVHSRSALCSGLKHANIVRFGRDAKALLFHVDYCAVAFSMNPASSLFIFFKLSIGKYTMCPAS